MSAMTRRNLVSWAFAPFGLAMAGKIGAASGTQPPCEPQNSDAKRRFPDIEVVTHEGKRARLYSDLIKGRIVLVNFFYAHCKDFCPPHTANLLKVQRLLGDRVGRDIFMYSLTLTPVSDTPQVLAEYMRGHGIGPGWEFITGRPSDIKLVRQKLGFKDADGKFDGDPSRHIGVLLYGNDAVNRWSALPVLTDAREIVRQISWLDPAPTAYVRPPQPAHQRLPQRE